MPSQQPMIVAPPQRPIYIAPAQQQPQVQAQPGGQTCNVFGCGAAPNVFGSSPHGECTVFGCPGPQRENQY